MADFFQNGVIATLHNLGHRDPGSFEADLGSWSAERRPALIIPILARELDGSALKGIVAELAEVEYLAQLIVGLDDASPEQFARAKQLFATLPNPATVLWNDGPNLRAIDAELQVDGLAPAERGKGRNVWYCLGYFLASGQADVVAIHDGDISTYRRSMLARLLHPVMNPTFDYSFAKGYYYRAGDDRLNGRASRLLVTPLVRAMASTLGRDDYLDYIDSFRYPLAGECAMTVGVAESLRLPSDWGLEIGILSEVFRRYTPTRICQVDIADAYDHKHQDLSVDDAEAGLHKMAIDIAKALYRRMAAGGAIFGPETFRTLQAAYLRRARELIDRYHDDATLNGFTYDRNEEEEAAELFALALLEAGERFLTKPMEPPLTPNWSRIAAAKPDLASRLLTAVAADNA